MGRRRILGDPLRAPLYEKVALLLADALGVCLLLPLARWARLGDPGLASLADRHFPGLALAVLLVFYVLDLYTTRSRIFGLGLPARTLVAVLALVPALTLYVYLFAASSFRDVFLGRGVLALFLSGLLPWCLLSRSLVRTALRAGRDSRWLVVGGGGAGAGDFRDGLRESPPHGMAFRFVEDGTEDAAAALAEGGWDGIAIDDAGGADGAGDGGPAGSAARLALSGTRVLALGDLYESLWGKVPPGSLGSRSTVLSVNRSLLRGRPVLRVKRAADVALSVALLAPALPFALLAAALVKLEDGGPVIYRQTRTGLGGEPFTMLKFRSMRTDAEKGGVRWAREGDDRVTRIGRLMRLFHFDEVPQLVNVLRGEMSLVGPRPERPEQIALLEREVPSYALRHSVRPGLTGWAQVLHPYGASVADAKAKLQYDLYYIKRGSLALDAAVFAKTVRVVLTGRGR